MEHSIPAFHPTLAAAVLFASGAPAARAITTCDWIGSVTDWHGTVNGDEPGESEAVATAMLGLVGLVVRRRTRAATSRR